MPTALDVAYRAARYRVFAQMPFTLRVGEASAELDALLDSHVATTWAFVTACNPGSQPLSAEENAERMAQLHVLLVGYPVYPGEGCDPAGEWPAEPSVLVVGISREEAVRVAAVFGQNAILTGVRGGPVELVWV